MKFLFLILLLSMSQSFAKNKLLTYDPTVVELTGALDEQTFPGPPNYYSIKDGDEIEGCYYFKLDQPIDVRATKDSAPAVNSDPEKNVKVVQLAILGTDEKLWKIFRKIGVGGRAKIKGTLFHRWTGHHHARVLLSVTEVEPLNKVSKKAKKN